MGAVDERWQSDVTHWPFAAALRKICALPAVPTKPSNPPAGPSHPFKIANKDHPEGD